MNFNIKVTVMGLGLHGGGLASALFFAEHGSRVTVTDLRSEEVLAPSMQKLEKYPISYTLGEHKLSDFETADIVIKNPAVLPSSPFLRAAKQVETDISIFLSLNKRPLIAVTGSKGKSTTVSAIYHVLKKHFPETKLGGNITVSPLTFADKCTVEREDPVILELSSWQLADLKDKHLLYPKTAVITNIMHDHQNRYSSMQEYIDDKKLIYQDMNSTSHLICNFDEPTGRIFASESTAKSFFVSKDPLPPSIDGAFLTEESGFIQENGKVKKVLPEETNIKGKHNKLNLLYAASVLNFQGLDNNFIAQELSAFSGIPHRMEKVTVINGVTWYNDSASTIPQAAAAAVESIQEHVLLICGGTDKNLDFTGFAEAARIPESIYLLKGTATDRMIPLLKAEHISFQGPFVHLQDAVSAAYNDSRRGDSVIFSPGATSFGMFLNEFDRGDTFRSMVLKLSGSI